MWLVTEMNFIYSFETKTKEGGTPTTPTENKYVTSGSVAWNDSPSL